MRFARTLKPEACCSVDPTRPRINYVELSRVDMHPAGEQFYLVATDGHSLSRLAVEDASADVPGPIQAEAFALARKAARKLKLPDVTMTCTATEIILPDGMRLPRVVCDVDFPDYARVIPTRGGADGDRVVRFGINPALLAGVTEAMAGTSDTIVEVEVNLGTEASQSTWPMTEVMQPFRVRKDDNISVVMPARV